MTGVLKAKVAGTWIEIPGVPGPEGPTGPPGPTGPAGASEEVFIGPSDPGGGYDLWYDTDAPDVPVDPRLGLRVAWENDSVSMPNNTAENTLATYTIPGGSVTPLGGPGGMKWVFALHALIQSTSAAVNLTLRCKVNGTSAIGTSTISIPSGTGERLVEIDWTLLGDNDYNLNQKARFGISGLMAPPTTTDDLPTRRGYTRGNTIVAATWASDIVLTMTAQWASATGTVCDMHGWDVIRYLTTPG